MRKGAGCHDNAELFERGDLRWVRGRGHCAGGCHAQPRRRPTRTTRITIKLSPVTMETTEGGGDAPGAESRRGRRLTPPLFGGELIVSGYTR